MLEDGVPYEKREFYRTPLMAVVRFLAQHPEDKDVRASFSRLLSVEACGELGLPVIAVTMLDLARNGIALAKASTNYRLNRQERTRRPTQGRRRRR